MMHVENRGSAYIYNSPETRQFHTIASSFAIDRTVHWVPLGIVISSGQTVVAEQATHYLPDHARIRSTIDNVSFTLFIQSNFMDCVDSIHRLNCTAPTIYFAHSLANFIEYGLTIESCHLVRPVWDNWHADGNDQFNWFAEHERQPWSTHHIRFHFTSPRSIYNTGWPNVICIISLGESLLSVFSVFIRFICCQWHMQLMYCLFGDETRARVQFEYSTMVGEYKQRAQRRYRRVEAINMHLCAFARFHMPRFH